MSTRAGPNHPFYKTSSDTQIEDVRKSIGYDDEKSLNEAIDSLDEWVRKQNHFVVKELEREYLEAFIIMAKGSLEVAKRRIDVRMTITKLYPELFISPQPEKDLKDLFKSYTFVQMPVPTKDYYRVSIDILESDGIEDFKLMDYGKHKNLIAEYSMLNDYVLGFEGIIDIRNIKSSQLLNKVNLIALQKLTTMTIKAYGSKLKSMHIISTSKAVDMLVSLLRQCVNEKVSERIHVHDSPDKLVEYIDKECLPNEFGGTGGNIKDLNEKLLRELYSDKTKKRLEVVSQYCTDESLRISGKFNEDYMGLPGSFRSLSVD